MDSFDSDAFCDIIGGGHIIAGQKHWCDTHSFQLFNSVCRIFTYHVGKCDKSYGFALSMDIDHRCAFGKLFIDLCFIRWGGYSEGIPPESRCQQLCGNGAMVAERTQRILARGDQQVLFCERGYLNSKALRNAYVSKSQGFGLSFKRSAE